MASTIKHPDDSSLNKGEISSNLDPCIRRRYKRGVIMRPDDKCVEVMGQKHIEYSGLEYEYGGGRVYNHCFSG